MLLPDDSSSLYFLRHYDFMVALSAWLVPEDLALRHVVSAMFDLLILRADLIREGGRTVAFG